MVTSHMNKNFLIFTMQGYYKQTVKVMQLMEAEGFEVNVIMLNILINAFGTAGRHMEALSIYHHMKESVSFFFDLIISHGQLFLHLDTPFSKHLEFLVFEGYES